MFNTLASYLFWNTSNSDTENSIATNNQESENAASTGAPIPIDPFEKLTLPKSKLTEVEDDWLLLDNAVDEEKFARTDSEGEVPFVEIKKSRSRNRRRKNNQNNQKSDIQNEETPRVAHNVNLNAPPNSMEESWFMTPPPCFTSAGPVNMETSPFENLLIEHPSMSVYCSFANGDDIMEEEEELEIPSVDSDIVVVNSDGRQLDVALTPQQWQRLLAYDQMELNNNNNQQQLGIVKSKQGSLYRNGQKASGMKTRQELCRSVIERNNKTREQSSKSGRQRRSDMTHCKIISRANNNRKC